MKRIRVTPRMAARMIGWLQMAGIVEFDDTKTIDDLMQAAGKKVEATSKLAPTGAAQRHRLVEARCNLGRT
jgi:hypothetical protein